MKAFRYALPGGIAAIVVGACVAFLTFTYAPPVGGPGVAVYVRAFAALIAFGIGAGVVWFATVLIIQAKFASDVFDDGDEDPFDDPFFDR